MTTSRSTTKNPMQITAPTGGIAAGGLKLISGTLFFCPEAISAGATGAGYWKDSLLKGAPKADGTGKAWVKGQKLYWDASAGKFTTTATGNTLRGIAAETATAGATTGDVELLQIGA
jgi:predicted RecA/RadA family phage recombinase